MRTLKNLFTYIETVTILSLFLVFMIGFSSCKKEFLDKKPSKSLLVPTTLTDFDALLDNNNVFNIGPELNEIASDDLYTTTAGWQGLYTPEEQNAYIFADDVYGSQTYISEWSNPYQQVFYSNVILDGLNNLSPANSSGNYDRVKGSALFSRAFAFYNLSQLFCKPYNSKTAATDLGIPLRLTSDVNLKSVRATLQQTYDQVIADLKIAITLLPLTPKYKSRPSKTAAQGLLARIYLSMGEYVNAGTYADNCISAYSKLYDYNSLDSTSYSPFPYALPNSGDEIIYYTRLTGYGYEVSSLTFVDSTLYRSYKNGDLRRSVFFADNGSGIFNYKGTYEGNYYFFGGIATDELYMIRAECEARAGNTSAALADLNTLLVTRWKTGTFTKFTAANADAALNLVLQERRKELIARGLRWSDLRRLNFDPRFQVTVSHPVDGVSHTLAPGDKHFVFPIPDYEIKASGIQQN